MENELFKILSNARCIKYNIEWGANNNNNRIENRALIKVADQVNYLDPLSGQWYQPSQISPPYLDIEEFRKVQEIFRLIDDSKITIENLEDVKKIYAIKILEEMESLNDLEKISYITKLV